MEELELPTDAVASTLVGGKGAGEEWCVGGGGVGREGWCVGMEGLVYLCSMKVQKSNYAMSTTVVMATEH